VYMYEHVCQVSFLLIKPSFVSPMCFQLSASISLCVEKLSQCSLLCAPATDSSGSGLRSKHVLSLAALCGGLPLCSLFIVFQ